ncbi:regulatory signaling modulator protein AmpE [Rheinheimera texasensis]|uniref:regulatory signaling modulator protein AmpE n=1 Tax=Rheinheimera texasensis TaxID=306205 RepID=UPI0032B2D48A
MTLLTMLIALIVERLAVRGSAWQLVTYLRPYLQRGQRVTLPGLPQPYLMLLWWLLPALLVTLLIYSVQFWLLQLVLNTLVLLLCIGSWSFRQTYKQFLNAAQRDDQEAAFLAMQQIRTAQGAPELSYGQQLIWLNFRYYAAVLFWYALLGAFGAVAYACLRQLSEPGVAAQNSVDETAEPAAEDSPITEFASTATVADEQWRRFADDLLHWADWLPVRLFGLGLALVGDFSRTSAVLLQHAGSFQMHAPDLLAELSQAAEPVPEELLNTPDAAVSAVALAKRNVLFFLALIAVLTLSGWLS